MYSKLIFCDFCFVEPVSNKTEDSSDGKIVTENGTVKIAEPNDASNVITTTAEISHLQNNATGLLCSLTSHHYV